jgi:hypothetical protein
MFRRARFCVAVWSGWKTEVIDDDQVGVIIVLRLGMRRHGRVAFCERHWRGNANQGRGVGDSILGRNHTAKTGRLRTRAPASSKRSPNRTDSPSNAFRVEDWTGSLVY